MLQKIGKLFWSIGDLFLAPHFWAVATLALFLAGATLYIFGSFIGSTELRYVGLAFTSPACVFFSLLYALILFWNWKENRGSKKDK
jgi:hypothetical protein